MGPPIIEEFEPLPPPAPIAPKKYLPPPPPPPPPAKKKYLPPPPEPYHPPPSYGMLQGYAPPIVDEYDPSPAPKKYLPPPPPPPPPAPKKYLPPPPTPPHPVPIKYPPTPQPPPPPASKKYLPPPPPAPVQLAPEPLVVHNYIPHKSLAKFHRQPAQLHAVEPEPALLEPLLHNDLEPLPMPAHHPKLQKPHVAVQRHPHLTYADPLGAMYPDDPAVYHYTYSVEDDYTGAQIYADEARDDQLTHGMYEVSLSDGRMQSVSYTSDDYGGYKAKVAYRDQHSSYTRTR